MSTATYSLKAAPGPLRLFAAAVMALALAACANQRSTTSSGSGEPPPPSAHPSGTVVNADLGEGLLGNNPNAVRVAFLAPLSGQAAGTGQALLNAAQVAAIQIAPQNFVLQPYDTGGSAHGASQAAQTAVAQGARMIVGPLFAESVRAVGPVAAQTGVPVVAFSTDASVAGGNVNLISFLPGEQLHRVFEHALRNGKTSVAVLAPNTASGRGMIETARAQAQSLGMRFAGGETYEASGAGADQAITRLRNLGRFDVLLLADSGPALLSIANQLPGGGVTPGSVLIVGTAKWANEPGLGRNPVLVGARFAAPDESSLKGFRESYQRTFGQAPPDNAALGYDATALAAVLARGGPGAFTIEAVRNPQGFVGVGGLFRFRANGTVERGFAIREITAGGSNQVEPAPRSFSGPML